jgi:hypothetical protein
MSTTSPAEKLARVDELLNSTYESERATAAQMASTMLKALSLTWTQLVHRGLGAQPAKETHVGPEPSASSAPGSERNARGERGQRARTKERNGVPAWKWVDEILKHDRHLSGWDRQFLQCLRDLGKTATRSWP